GPAPTTLPPRPSVQRAPGRSASTCRAPATGSSSTRSPPCRIELVLCRVHRGRLVGRVAEPAPRGLGDVGDPWDGPTVVERTGTVGDQDGGERHGMKGCRRGGPQ